MAGAPESTWASAGLFLGLSQGLHSNSTLSSLSAVLSGGAVGATGKGVTVGVCVG